MAVEPADDRILRAKYLDWCSAQVADRFLRLTPDEIYQLAHQPPAGDAAVARLHEVKEVFRASVPGPLSESTASRSAVLSPPEPNAPGLSYRDLVRRVTEALTASMALPPFDRWIEAYRAAPERFESEMVGFWEDGEGQPDQ